MRRLVAAEIIHGDALTELRSMDAASASLVIADPPYFKVKDRTSCGWDHQWSTAEDYLDWLGLVCREIRRVLAPNGSLYLFAGPRMASRVECLVAQHFDVLNRITWRKENGWARKQCKEEMRAFWPASEAIIFAEQQNSDSRAMGVVGYAAKCDELRGFVFEPLRKYLADEWKRAGLKPEQANEACGTASMAARHYFTRSQWALPTASHYAALQRYANASQEKRKYLRRDYEDLRRDYEDLRRPFTVSAGVPYTDVWDFATVPPRNGKHPCQKPLELIQHMVRASSRPGDLVLDPFAGSGSTGVAALMEGRRFIGIEKEAAYVEIGRRRLAEARAS